MNNKIFSFLIIISIFLNLPLKATEKTNQSNSKIKTALKIGGTIFLAYKVDKISQPITHFIHNKPYSALYKYIPGSAISKDILHSVCYIGMTYVNLLVLKILQDKINKQTSNVDKKVLKDILKKPITVYTELFKNISEISRHKKNYSEVSAQNTFFKALEFFEANNIWSESLTRLLLIYGGAYK